MKPVIGIIPLWDDERESIWMVPGYMNMLREAGAVPLIFPLVADEADLLQLCSMCSGFLLTGGHDVAPELYGEPKSERCGVTCPERDLIERVVFDYAIAEDRPLLGICRGIQLINALCGGTLYQDLPTEYPSNGVTHSMIKPYDRVWHRVNIVEGSELHKIVGETTLGVNSYHHQAIKELAPYLEAMAISEDGLIEALSYPSKRFVMALQWHPELNYHCDESSRAIVLAFVEAARQ
ncbi:MAG: gamma-glutamyl-gamma-aminobutyrate hydrolase family protein [Rikenellaceae bacterium]